MMAIRTVALNSRWSWVRFRIRLLVGVVFVFEFALSELSIDKSTEFDGYMIEFVDTAKELDRGETNLDDFEG